MKAKPILHSFFRSLSQLTTETKAREWLYTFIPSLVCRHPTASLRETKEVHILVKEEVDRVVVQDR